MDSLWITILSSAGIASVISAIMGYIFNVLMQKRKYKDDYYKMVISKRMEAYANVERVIKLLKTNTSDDGGETAYCIAFGSNDALLTLCRMVYDALVCNMWLSEDMHNTLNKLNEFIVRAQDGCKKKGFDTKLVGLECDDVIIKSRTDLEKYYTADMLNLYDVEGFLKSKKKNN